MSEHSKDFGQSHGPQLKMYPSGVYFDLENPDPDDIHIDDIAHHLSLINRFNGGTPRPYSVAEHCLVVSARLKRRGCGPEFQLAGLIHDAAEAYIGDMNGTLKPYMTEYKEVEAKLEEAVYGRFGLADMVGNPFVKQADMDVFDMECTLVRDNPCRIPQEPSLVAEMYAYQLSSLAR